MKRWIVGLAALACGTAGAAAQVIRPSADTLVVGMGSNADTFDPEQINSRDTANIAEHIWASLYEIDATGKQVPYLAKSYTWSDDGKQLSFELNAGLTCEDGEPLTAEDVAYTFERAADPANKFTGNTPGFVLSGLGYVGMRVDDDLHVTVLTKFYNPISLDLIRNVSIHCRDSYRKMTLAEAARHPIGSGPYRMVEWTPDDKIVLERNDAFTLRKAPYRRIVWRIIPDTSTRSAELLAGNVDVITNVAPDQKPRIDASGVAKVAVVSGTRRIYTGFNLKPAFAKTPGGAAVQKADVRRALQYAVDIPTICKTLLGVPCDRAVDLVVPPAGNPDLKPYPYDPAEAERRLDAAGYPRGPNGVRFDLTLQSPRGRYLADADVSAAVAQYLTDVGVKTTVDYLEWTSKFMPASRTHDLGPLFLLGTGSGFEALNSMNDFNSIDAATNYVGWTDPNWFDGWKEIQATRDPQVQRTVINRMLKVFHDDGPWLLMYFQPDFYGVSNRIDWQPRRDERIYFYDIINR